MVVDNRGAWCTGCSLQALAPDTSDTRDRDRTVEAFPVAVGDRAVAPRDLAGVRLVHHVWWSLMVLTRVY